MTNKANTRLYLLAKHQHVSFVTVSSVALNKHVCIKTHQAKMVNMVNLLAKYQRVKCCYCEQKNMLAAYL